MFALLLAAAMASPSASPAPSPTPCVATTDGSGNCGSGTSDPGGRRPGVGSTPSPSPSPTADVTSANCVRAGAGKPCYAIETFTIAVSAAARVGEKGAPSTFLITRRTDAASALFRAAASASTPLSAIASRGENGTATLYVTYRGSTFELVDARLTRVSETSGTDTISGTFLGTGKPLTPRPL